MDPTPFAELAAVDRLVHEPSRLAILSALLACAEADFRYLLSVTGLTKGNLSSHLSKLEAGGLVAVEKGYEGKIPWTRARLTAGRAQPGRGALARTSNGCAARRSAGADPLRGGRVASQIEAATSGSLRWKSGTARRSSACARTARW